MPRGGAYARAEPCEPPAPEPVREPPREALGCGVAPSSKPGARVRVVGLKKAARHNGTLGRILDQANAPEGRVVVKLDGRGETIAARPENLELVDAVDAPAPAARRPRPGPPATGAPATAPTAPTVALSAPAVPAEEEEECPVCLESAAPIRPYKCAHGLCAKCATQTRKCPLCRAAFAPEPAAAAFELPDLSGTEIIEPGGWRQSEETGEATCWEEVERVIYYDSRPLSARERRIWDDAVASGECQLRGHDSVGWTRLHNLAAGHDVDYRQKIDWCRAWVAAGLDIDARTTPGPGGHSNFTPSHHAAMHDNAAMIVCLHQLGADQTLRSKKGLTPLGTAIGAGALRSVFALLRLGSPARGVQAVDLNGAQLNLADLVASSCANNAESPGRHATLDPVPWRKLWDFATGLEPPLEKLARGAFERGIHRLENPPAGGLRRAPNLEQILAGAPPGDCPVS